ncbi:hypothetical protein FGO68_gene6500 [Halteria grandinella]|uniref:Uncharacterized protein n=1 Tax=Halteria grandinella TaxID=5974 RepID=A0A8J8SVR3_HALGN|nr:hypothetical protein FGO68_gene6500 [Halteria grandinella]
MRALRKLQTNDIIIYQSVNIMNSSNLLKTTFLTASPSFSSANKENFNPQSNLKTQSHSSNRYKEHEDLDLVLSLSKSQISIKQFERVSELQRPSSSRMQMEKLKETLNKVKKSREPQTFSIIKELQREDSQYQQNLPSTKESLIETKKSSFVQDYQEEDIKQRKVEAQMRNKIGLQSLQQLASKQREFLQTSREHLDTSQIGISSIETSKLKPDIKDKLKDLKNIMHGLKTSRISLK